jgi:hypothetical protein
MPLFRTAFVPPAPLEGLTATAVGGAFVLLEWTPSGLAPEDFVAYTVARSLDGLSYAELARISDQGTASFADYAAPLDRPLWYRVTVESLDGISDPAEATSELAGCAFWLVTPGAPEASFELPNVTAYESAWPLQSIEHEPIGRSRKLVETGLLLGEEGRLTAHLLPADDPAVLVLLRAAVSGASTGLLLKTPYGEVYAVALGSIARVRGPGGEQDVSFRFVAV